VGGPLGTPAGTDGALDGAQFVRGGGLDGVQRVGCGVSQFARGALDAVRLRGDGRRVLLPSNRAETPADARTKTPARAARSTSSCTSRAARAAASSTSRHRCPEQSQVRARTSSTAHSYTFWHGSVIPMTKSTTSRCEKSPKASSGGGFTLQVPLASSHRQSSWSL
jgi:hypothetical protein